MSTLPPWEGLPILLRRELENVAAEHAMLRKFYEAGELATLRDALLFLNREVLWKRLHAYLTPSA